MIWCIWYRYLSSVSLTPFYSQFQLDAIRFAIILAICSLQFFAHATTILFVETLNLPPKSYFKTSILRSNMNYLCTSCHFCFCYWMLFLLNVWVVYISAKHTDKSACVLIVIRTSRMAGNGTWIAHDGLMRFDDVSKWKHFRRYRYRLRAHYDATVMTKLHIRHTTFT